MARVLTEGFEMADELMFVGGSAPGSINSSVKRTGGYSYKSSTLVGRLAVPTDTQYYAKAAFYTDNASSATHRFAWYDASGRVGAISFLNGVVNYCLGTSTTPSASGGVTISANEWHLLEVYVFIDNTVGRVIVQLDGVTEINFTGDTAPGTSTNIASFGFLTAAGVNDYWDDVAVNSADLTSDGSWCGEGYVTSVYPTADGDVTLLTPSSGSNYAVVDKVPYTADSTYVYTSTNDNYDLYQVLDFDLTGWDIRGVWIETTMLYVAAGGLHQLGVKTHSTEYWGDSVSLATGYNRIKSTRWATNPNTSALWSQSEINDVQIGAKMPTAVSDRIYNARLMIEYKVAEPVTVSDLYGIIWQMMG